MRLKCWVNAVTSTTPNPYQFFFVVPRVIVIGFIVESPVPPATLGSVVMPTVMYMMMVIIIERFPELLPGQCLGRGCKGQCCNGGKDFLHRLLLCKFSEVREIRILFLFHR